MEILLQNKNENHVFNIEPAYPEGEGELLYKLKYADWPFVMGYDVLRQQFTIRGQAPAIAVANELELSRMIEYYEI